MGSRTVNILSLCTGGGGLDLGLRLAMPSIRTICCIEHEAFAIEILAERMEEKVLAAAPIWTDLTTFDGRPWRGKIHGIIGGLPCQPSSLAGRRLGKADPRYLFPHFIRIMEECQPDFCFLENVPGFVSIGLEEVLGELQGLGYQVESGIFSAAEMGAPHLRKRLFILGVRDVADPRCERRQQVARGAHGDEIQDEGRSKEEGDEPERRDEDVVNPEGGRALSAQFPGQRDGPLGAEQIVADACGARLEIGAGFGRDIKQERPSPERGGEDVANAQGGGRGVVRGAWAGDGLPDVGDKNVAHAQGLRGAEVERGAEDGILQRLEANPRIGIRGSVVPVFPPRPGDIEAWREVLAKEPRLEPALRELADELADGVGVSRVENRIGQLRLLGNGVLPACAAYGFCVLLGKLVGIGPKGK